MQGRGIEPASTTIPGQSELRRVTLLLAAFVAPLTAFMPDYAAALRTLAAPLGERVIWTGDRADVPDLLVGRVIFCWLSRGKGMPHVIAEAGAAGLPVIATPDNGALQQITDGTSGIFVPHENPAAVAAALRRLLDDALLRRRHGQALQAHVRSSYAAEVVVPQWQALIEEVLAERPAAAATAGGSTSPPLSAMTAMRSRTTASFSRWGS